MQKTTNLLLPAKVLPQNNALIYELFKRSIFPGFARIIYG